MPESCDPYFTVGVRNKMVIWLVQDHFERVSQKIPRTRFTPGLLFLGELWILTYHISIVGNIESSLPVIQILRSFIKPLVAKDGCPVLSGSSNLTYPETS